MSPTCQDKKKIWDFEQISNAKNFAVADGAVYEERETDENMNG